MFIFVDYKDLLQTIELMKDRANRASTDTSNLRREQKYAQARAGAFDECLSLLRDYFAVRDARGS